MPKFFHREMESRLEEDFEADEVRQAHGYWSNGDIRLMPEDEQQEDDSTPTSGRLELYIDTLLEGAGNGEDSVGTWGTVCGMGFTLREAHVACRQLGFAAAIKFELSSQTR